MSPGWPSGFRLSMPGKVLGTRGSDHEAGIFPAQGGADAGERPAGADAGDQNIRQAASVCGQLDQDLLAGALVVSSPVILVGVLVAVPIAFRLLFRQAVSSAQGVVVPLDWVGENQFGSVGADPVEALGTGVARYHEGHRNAQRGAEHGVGNTRVARRGVEEPPPAGKEARFLGLEKPARRPRPEASEPRRGLPRELRRATLPGADPCRLSRRQRRERLPAPPPRLAA